MPLKPNIANWRFITDATDQTKARKVLDWVLAKLESETHQLKIEPYHKGGFTLSFSTMPVSGSWPELVLDVLSCAERVGHGWHLSGQIIESLDASCDKPSVAGVTFIHVVCSHVQEA